MGMSPGGLGGCLPHSPAVALSILFSSTRPGGFLPAWLPGELPDKLESSAPGRCVQAGVGVVVL